MKNKYSDGGDIITSDDDNPDDQEVYRDFQSTGVKIRDTPPGKKAVGRNTPRPTATRKQKDASPNQSEAETNRLRAYAAKRKQKDASPNQSEAETNRLRAYAAKRKQEDASPNQSEAETNRLRAYAAKAMPRPTAPRNQEMEFRSGGYVKSADGCAKRGKTKAKMV